MATPSLHRVVLHYTCGHLWEPDWDEWHGAVPLNAEVKEMLIPCRRCSPKPGFVRRLAPIPYEDLP